MAAAALQADTSLQPLVSKPKHGPDLGAMVLWSAGSDVSCATKRLQRPRSLCKGFASKGSVFMFGFNGHSSNFRGRRVRSRDSRLRRSTRGRSRHCGAAHRLRNWLETLEHQQRTGQTIEGSYSLSCYCTGDVVSVQGTATRRCRRHGAGPEQDIAITAWRVHSIHLREL